MLLIDALWQEPLDIALLTFLTGDSFSLPLDWDWLR
jgi:hypothetical protein